MVVDKRGCKFQASRYAIAYTAKQSPQQCEFPMGLPNQECKRYETTDMRINQYKQFMQAIAATDSCRVGQPDHAKSEHLSGGRNRAAAAMQPRFTSAMQTRTQDATPEPAKQTRCQRAPGKVRLRPDSIQLAPCFTMQPTRISRQNHTGLQGQTPYRARRQYCGYNYDSAMVTLPNICNHYATAMQSSATAVRSKQRNSRRCSSKQCSRRRKPQRHTTASRCQSKCRFFKVSFRNADETNHSNTGATQVQHHCKASSMATPMQT